MKMKKIILGSGTLHKLLDRLPEIRILNSFIYFSYQLFITYLPLYHFQSADHATYSYSFICKHFGKKVKVMTL